MKSGFDVHHPSEQSWFLSQEFTVMVRDMDSFSSVLLKRTLALSQHCWYNRRWPTCLSIKTSADAIYWQIYDQKVKMWTLWHHLTCSFLMWVGNPPFLLEQRLESVHSWPCFCIAYVFCERRWLLLIFFSLSTLKIQRFSLPLFFFPFLIAVWKKDF